MQGVIDVVFKVKRLLMTNGWAIIWRQRCCEPHIQSSKQGKIPEGGKARLWIVGRFYSWIHCFRQILSWWEKNWSYKALLYITSGLIIWNKTLLGQAPGFRIVTFRVWLPATLATCSQCSRERGGNMQLFPIFLCYFCSSSSVFLQDFQGSAYQIPWFPVNWNNYIS